MIHLPSISGKRVLAAMSGGVDSSLSAALLRQQGAGVSGATMRLVRGEEEEEKFYENSCCSLADVEDAKRAAARLGIPFQVLHMEEAFEDCVIRPFVREYELGRTPNPCIDCNRHLKFRLLLNKAMEQGFDYIATGHYAKVGFDESTGRYTLGKGADSGKDQSYVLYMLTQEELSHILFPLGELTKEQVRALALEYGLENAKKPESQDICFVPDGDYAGFIRRFTGKEYPPGDFVDESGQVLGRHKGQIAYTLGQRRGLGLSLKAPGYVVARDLSANTITVGSEERLMNRSLLAASFNWIAPEPETGEPVKCTVRTRYRQRETEAVAVKEEKGNVRVTFDAPIRAVTPGQSAVLYQGEQVIGGGIILEADPE